jgi:cell division protein DivIC
MKKAFRLLTNKFILTSAVFVVWMMYFDQYDYFMMKERNKQLDELKQNIQYLDKEIAQMDADRNAMLNNRARLEEYARENYYMKRDNEDLYVIENN